MTTRGPAVGGVIAGVVVVVALVYGYPALFPLIESQHPRHYRERTRTALEAGNTDRALRIARTGAEALLSEPDAQVHYARLLLSTGARDEAVRVLERAVGITSTGGARPTFTRKILYLYPAVLAVTALGVAVAPWLVVLFFGPSFAAAGPLLRVLILAFGLHIIFNPLALIFYSLDRPAVITAIHLVQLPLLIALNYFLIPPMGALGSTIAALVIRVLGVIAILILTERALAPSRQQLETRN